MTRRPIYHADGEDEGSAGDDVYEECEVCHQEFGGTCPIASVDCPYVEEDDDVDEVDDPDFEDVEKLDELIGDDAEVEKIIEEDINIPVEDLMDDEAPEKVEDDDTPSKTVEELEEEEREAKKKKRGPRHTAKKSKK